MSYAPVNATGWGNLYNGDLIGAAFTMYDTAFGHGWIILMLFLLFQFMLFFKTRNITILFVTGLLFLAVYISTTKNVFAYWSTGILFLVLAFELAGTLYEIVWKRNG